MSLGSWFFIAIALPLLAAPGMAFLGKRLKSGLGYVALLFPLLAFIAVLNIGFATGWQSEPTTYSFPWVPSLGINLTFLVDGLSLFYGMIVSGVGILVAFYAAGYLGSSYKHQGRFFAYLLMFMAAMLGTVFADNLILLFIFWELTGVTSFLLIGFSHSKEQSRTGARMAILVTGSTALFMFVGLLLLHLATGEFSMATLLSDGGVAGIDKDWLTLIFVLIILGGLGKSAQFPFQFWLPNAMAAPTPVSAYLHSATMVKLGVFLTARVYPMFHELPLWLPLLVIVCFGTMLLGAVLALLSNDLKAILAFATVSQLGFLIGFYGLNSWRGVEHDYVQILSHVFYKGALFMLAGIIDHCCGTRDIRKLGGLFRIMPLTGVLFLISAASMAGVPGTFGFVAKELMLKDFSYAAAHFGSWVWIVLGVVAVASILKVVFSIRLFHHSFCGPMKEEVRSHFHAPGLAIQLPPLLLTATALVLGFAPWLLDPVIAHLQVAAMHFPEAGGLKVWHGVNLELGISLAILGLGVALYLALQKTNWQWAQIPKLLRFDEGFELGLARFFKVAKATTLFMRHGRPFDYLPITVIFTAIVFAGYLLVIYGNDLGQALAAGLSQEDLLSPLRTLVALLVLLSAIGILVLKTWGSQLVALSVAGFLITFYFVLYRAPDLAMTQILIEVATLILLLLLLSRFRRAVNVGETPDERFSVRQVVSVVVAVVIGVSSTLFMILAAAPPTEEPIGPWFLAATYPLAEGTNAVNTILVDFRGIDTVGEITVLVIAMLGALGLLMRYKRSPQEMARGPLGQPGFGIHHDRRKSP